MVAEFLSVESLINTSLIGMGLLLALYTMISSHLSDLQRNHGMLSDSNSWKLFEKSVLKEASKGGLSRAEYQRQLKQAWKKMDRISSGGGYQYSWGHLISGSMFMVTIMLGFVLKLLPSISWNLSAIDSVMAFSTFFGTFNFFIIWIFIFWDMRALFREKLEIKEGIEDEVKVRKSKKKSKKK